MYDVDTATLQTFVMVAETGSFSRTGALIGRSQSAVSTQIRKLEETFRRKLLERDTRNVRLSPDGERLLGHACKMIAAADAMLARFRARDLAGSVRFGAPEDFASVYLSDVLGRFATAHDAVELQVTCKLTLPLVADFEAGLLDLIVLKQDPLRRHPGARPLWREPLVWLASPDMEPRFADAVQAQAMRGRPLPLVTAPAPCVYRNRATATLDAAHVAWTGVFVSPSHAGCAAAVRAGLGYAVMPRAMVPPGLAVLGAGDGWPDLAETEMAMLGAARLDPATQALAEFIEDSVARRNAA